ncbi:unnamed protein product [Sphagnum tenellum]
MPGRLSFGQGFDGVQDVLDREGPSEVSVGVLHNLHRHTGPALRLGLQCAESVRISGIEARVELSNVLGEVVLTRHGSGLGVELLQEECDELRATLNQGSVRCDEWGNCLVDHDGHVDANSLGASHRDALIPKGASAPKFDALGRALGVLLPEVVLLDEHNLGRGWERGKPHLDLLGLGRASPQPSYIEGGQGEGLLSHR